MSPEKVELSCENLRYSRLFFVILVIFLGGDERKMRKNRVEENRKRERLPPVRRRAKTDIVQRQKRDKKEQISQIGTATMGPINQSSTQERMRPPSRSPTGRRLRSPSAAETDAKKDRSPSPRRVAPSGAEARTDKKLTIGPARQINNSFL